jgi:hypothetical protein
MGTGQMFLTIMAVMLLGVTIMSVNRNNLNQGTILRQTEIGIYAVSLATSYIQKAAAMDFDQKTVSGLVYITVPMPQPPSIPAATLTAPGSLGFDGSATTPIEVVNKDDTYNDFDDYNGYVYDTTITSVDKFHVTASVYYVNQTPPYTKNTANITWLKQMDIKINNSIDRKVFQGSSTSGTDTIKMSYIMGFYK